MKKIILPIIVIVVSLVYKCDSSSNNVINATEYYFPYMSFLDSPKVYVYAIETEKNNNPDTLYWKFESAKNDNGYFLISESYNKEGIQSKGKELLSFEASTFVQNSVFEYSLKGKVFEQQAHIIDSLVFPFYIEKGEIYELSHQFTSIYNNNEIKIKRIRKFKKFGEIDYKNQKVKCIEFDTKEIFSTKSKTQRINVREYFAQNLGLVRTVKTIDKSTIIITLIDILSVDEFEKL